jgi:hypothetical protein
VPNGGKVKKNTKTAPNRGTGHLSFILALSSQDVFFFSGCEKPIFRFGFFPASTLSLLSFRLSAKPFYAAPPLARRSYHILHVSVCSSSWISVNNGVAMRK